MTSNVTSLARCIEVCVFAWDTWLKKEPLHGAFCLWLAPTQKAGCCICLCSSKFQDTQTNHSCTVSKGLPWNCKDFSMFVNNIVVNLNSVLACRKESSHEWRCRQLEATAAPEGSARPGQYVREPPIPWPHASRIILCIILMRIASYDNYCWKKLNWLARLKFKSLLKVTPSFGSWNHA